MIVNYKKLVENDNEEIQNVEFELRNIDKTIKNLNKEEKTLNVFSIIDALAVKNGEDFINDFSVSFNKEMGIKTNSAQYVKFNLLSEDMIKAQYDVTVTGGTLNTTIGTDIAPTIEAFIRNVDPFLSLITYKKAIAPQNSYQLWDYDEEVNAAILAETAAGPDSDDTTRTGDLLLARNKIQASTKISELAFSTMDGLEAGIFIARITKRVKFFLAFSILNSGFSASNGTSRSTTIRGVVNNFGVNGTGDTTGTIGAIQYPTKALADAAIVARNGSNSTDAYDLCLKVKKLLLPTNVAEVEEEDYKFIMNRNTWGIVSLVPDLNGRLKAHNAFDPITGKAIRMIDGTEVIIVPSAGLIPDGFIHLMPPKMINCMTFGDIANLNDGGIVQLREGLISFVSRIFCDASMRYAQKYKRTTAVTIGTTAADNIDQNAFRYFRIF
jgi:hypothetical protein